MEIIELLFFALVSWHLCVFLDVTLFKILFAKLEIIQRKMTRIGGLETMKKKYIHAIKFDSAYENTL